ncbi:MAG: hypothetical protein KDH09_11660 [Chrysiogenetes bacterium]|nr:hypothetical protein [Chrysiogenetes bacterium]
MPKNISLIFAMAEQCREMLKASSVSASDQPQSLQPKHLVKMCDEIIEHARDWPSTKAHRWIGFIQGAMIANGMINLEEAKVMFDKIKKAYEKSDEDVLDHLDVDKFFELEIGGQG